MDQLLKIIELAMNFTQAKSQTVSRQMLTTIRKLIIFIAVALAAMVLFCVGVSLVLSDLVSKSGNPVLIGSIVAGLSLTVFFFCLRQKAWLKAAYINVEEKEKVPSPIEQALALFITDMVVERQAKRVHSEGQGNPNEK